MNKYHHDLVKLYDTTYDSIDKTNSLDYFASKSDELVCKKFLGDYSFFGQYYHLQLYALLLLIHSVKNGEKEYLKYFTRYLDLINGFYLERLKENAGQGKYPPVETSISEYFVSPLEFLKAMISCSMEGYLKILGKEAYPYFVDIICNCENDNYFRSHALVRLCQHSGYEFADFIELETNGFMKLFSRIKKNLQIFGNTRLNEMKLSTINEILNEPNIPGNWNQIETENLIKKIIEWSQLGYPSKAQTEFIRDIALDNPITPLEKICRLLEVKIKEQHKLDLERSIKNYEHDLEKKKKKLLKYPHTIDDTHVEKSMIKVLLDAYLEEEKKNLFFKARALDMEKIDTRWKLPSLYREFLERFSSHHSFNVVPHKSIRLASADRLEDQQKEYNNIEDPKYNPMTFMDHIPYIKNTKWPEKYLVIATYMGGRVDYDNIFFMDLSLSDGIDAPIYFVRLKRACSSNLKNLVNSIKVANSILELLERIAAGDDICRDTSD